MQNKPKIEHNRPECIGCGVCAAMAEKFWLMDQEGKSHLISSQKLETQWETKEIEEEEFQINKEAAEACPVNVIHLIDKTGKKII